MSSQRAFDRAPGESGKAGGVRAELAGGTLNVDGLIVCTPPSARIPIVKSAFERGARSYEFLGAAEPWKLEWTQASRAHEWLYVFSSTRRAQLLHWMKFQKVPELKKWRA